jgi:hypothetical protein
VSRFPQTQPHSEPTYASASQPRPRARGYRPANLPPERQSPDARVEEVMAYRRESARTVFRKLQSGAYRSYKSGDTRLIEWASVIEDRDRCLKLGAQLAEPPPPGQKRRVGRPKKTVVATRHENPSSEPEPEDQESAS